MNKYREQDSTATVMKSLSRFIRKAIEAGANKYILFSHRLTLEREIPFRFNDENTTTVVYSYTIHLSDDLYEMLREKRSEDRTLKALCELVGVEYSMNNEPFNQVSITSTNRRYDLGEGDIIKDDGSTIENTAYHYIFADGVMIVVVNDRELDVLHKLESVKPVGDRLYHFYYSKQYVYLNRHLQGSQLTSPDKNGNYWAVIHPIEDQAFIQKIYREHKHVKRSHVISAV
ncbi:hypothetical protein C8E01_102331 [Pontibacter virosus]|uniref:Uncharacterized protein n=2 Tax=Pontibacter virosus TaxID=1765052 RepID=A0A2U1B395_9BACT|nr:hypothetical protein C8E01_102331 [Pontibacter virosus]